MLYIYIITNLTYIYRPISSFTSMAPILPSTGAILPHTMQFSSIKPMLLPSSMVNHGVMTTMPIQNQPMTYPYTQAPPEMTYTTIAPPLVLQSSQNTITHYVTPPSLSTTGYYTTPASTIDTMTTDPLFKHYKQPSEPLRGPMYLIIQGHSKVKTYGPAKQIHGIQIQETNEIQTSDDGEFKVKHLHGFKKPEKVIPSRIGRSGNLQTLSHVVKTGYGAVNVDTLNISDDLSSHTVHVENTNRRSDSLIQETELRASFVAKKEATSEKYYKGIVESARKLKDASDS